MDQINKKTVINALLRKDFKSFVIKVFKEVSTTQKYLDNWHIDVICNELLNVMEGKQNRLIINIPPRYMKSIICSIALPAFILGHNPRASIIVVSYAEGLSSEIADNCKRVMESAWYKDIFPGTKLSKSKNAAYDFKTTRGGGRYATSVTGTLTGRGADYIIVDDPIKPDDAKSDNMREKNNDWYGSTLCSRLNDKKSGKIIVIMQRLHEDDFTGHLLEMKQSFKHIRIPAIAEEDEKWFIKDRIMSEEILIKERKKNEALHPEREDLKILFDIKSDQGEYNFAGQYQQNPAPIEGCIIKEKWLQFYDKEQLFKDIENDKIKIVNIFQSWDTASKVGKHNDYTACITALHASDGKTYILDVFRERLEFPDLIRRVDLKYKEEKEEYKHSVKLLIEEENSGIALIQELKNKHEIYPIPIKPEYDKETRLKIVSNLIENGTCLFPEDRPYWWMDFEKELLRFPAVKHDDQADALSQLLYYVKNSSYRPWKPINPDRISKTPSLLDSYMSRDEEEMRRRCY